MDEFQNAVLLQYVVTKSFAHSPHHESELNWTEYFQVKQIGRNCVDKNIIKFNEIYFVLSTLKFVYYFQI
jgi:hypothetical protein